MRTTNPRRRYQLPTLCHIYVYVPCNLPIGIEFHARKKKNIKTAVYTKASDLNYTNTALNRSITWTWYDTLLVEREKKSNDATKKRKRSEQLGRVESPTFCIYTLSAVYSNIIVELIPLSLSLYLLIKSADDISKIGLAMRSTKNPWAEITRETRGLKWRKKKKREKNFRSHV